MKKFLAVLVVCLIGLFTIIETGEAEMAYGLRRHAFVADSYDFWTDQYGVVNVKDYGAVGDGVHDDTAAIQTAIATAKTAGGGKIYLPCGSYKVTSTLIIDASIYIESNDATILWYGGASPVFTLGGNGVTILYRLGLTGLKIDGRGLATIGLNIKDLQDAVFNDIEIKSCTANAIYITNTIGLGQPTGFLRFEKIKIKLREGTTPNANGIKCDGKSSGGSEGVTMSKFDDVRIEHANGDGVVFGDYGDNMIFNRLFTWRDNAETGIGVHYISDVTGNVSNTTFINPVLTAGLKIDHPNYTANHGITVINICASPGDLNTGITIPVYGPGAMDVNGFDSMGRTYGMAKVGSGKEVTTSDRFKFINYDATNQFFYTNDGVWKTAITGGNILNEGDDGSSCTLVTQAAVGNIAAIYDVATLGLSGIKPSKNPVMMVEIAAITLTNTIYRFGFMDSITDPPANGIYIDGSPPGNWKIVCRAAGVETSINTGIPIAVERRIFLIDVKNNQVVFYSRKNTDDYYTYTTSISTNIPTVPLDTVFMVKTLATSSSNMRLFNYMLQHELE